jgi:hypothetical protein
VLAVAKVNWTALGGSGDEDEEGQAAVRSGDKVDVAVRGGEC